MIVHSKISRFNKLNSLKIQQRPDARKSGLYIHTLLIIINGIFKWYALD